MAEVGPIITRYRPTSFDEFIGHDEEIATIKRMLQDRDRAPRAFLLHGPTGCGKTTLARIIARELGASEADVMEVDAADLRGIDTVRDIRRQAHYLPVAGDFRVWILDECHRLTQDAQSALLKALEEAPSHVRYILCTTDPQRLLPTIRGRCSAFQLRPLNERQMLKLLRRVVAQEGESLDREVYEQIVRSSGGRPREALQILGQVLAAPEEKRLEVASKPAVIEMTAVDLCRALLSNAPWKKIASIISSLENDDAESVRRAVLGYCEKVLLSGEENDRAAAIIEEFSRPFYDSGRPGLVLACYAVAKG